MSRIAIILFLSAHFTWAQQIGQNAPARGDTPATFSTSSQLVVETVNVKDKSGKPLEGLTAKDFTVTEDGAEQTIRLFEYQKVPEALDAEPADYNPVGSAEEASRSANHVGAAGRYPLSEPPVAGALLRHDRYAAAGPVARHRGGREIRPHPDDAGGPHGADAIRRRRGSGDVGFYRRSRSAWTASCKR
jgi:hypothetical protein